MYTREIQEQLEKFAQSDLNKIRKYGDITIARTKRGNVTATYENGVYTLSTFNVATMQSETLYTGKASGAKKAIVDLYDVVA